jgi:hypothetical protein
LNFLLCRITIPFDIFYIDFNLVGGDAEKQSADTSTTDKNKTF